MSLRWRLTLLVAGIVVLSVGGAALAAHFAARGELHKTVDDFLRSRSAAVTQELNDGPPPRRGPDQRQRERGDLVLQSPDAVTQVIDRKGDVIESVAGAPTLPIDEDDLELASKPGKLRIRDVEVDGVEYRMITRSVDGGAVQVARDLTETNDTLRGLNVSLLLIGAAGVAFAGLIGWLIGNRMARPVERLATQAQYVASTEDLNASVGVNRKDEIGDLANSFDAMLAALNRSKEEQQRLVQDASHELRTPLTSIRTNTEILQRRFAELDPVERQAVLDELNLEVVELSSLVGELVDLATDIDVQSGEMQEADLVEICTRAGDRLGNSHVVTVIGDAESMVECRPDDIERAVTNLVANAVKFSPEGSAIEIHVTGRAVEVRDHGPGIPEADLDLIFERFHRAAATRSLPGSGLGLAIVDRIVQQHGGRTHAANLPTGGAAVGFELSGPDDRSGRSRAPTGVRRHRR
jgi:two-component system sensor histidine kinase MprB